MPSMTVAEPSGVRITEPTDLPDREWCHTPTVTVANTVFTEAESLRKRIYFSEPKAWVNPQGGWLSSVNEEIQELLLLQTGWDGELAETVAVSTVRKAQFLACRIWDELPGLPRPTITPGIDGSVVMEWHTQSHMIEFVVGVDPLYLYMFDDSQDLEWEGYYGDDCPIDPLAFLNCCPW